MAALVAGSQNTEGNGKGIQERTRSIIFTVLSIALSPRRGCKIIEPIIFLDVVTAVDCRKGGREGGREGAREREREREGAREREREGASYSEREREKRDTERERQRERERQSWRERERDRVVDVLFAKSLIEAKPSQIRNGWDVRHGIKMPSVGAERSSSKLCMVLLSTVCPNLCCFVSHWLLCDWPKIRQYMATCRGTDPRQQHNQTMFGQASGLKSGSTQSCSRTGSTTCRTLRGIVKSHQRTLCLHWFFLCDYFCPKDLLFPSCASHRWQSSRHPPPTPDWKRSSALLGDKPLRQTASRHWHVLGLRMTKDG